MGDGLTFLRANPAILAVLVGTCIVLVVFGILAVLMTRAGVSLRPLVFVGVFFLIVAGPQAAFHLAQAFEWIPKQRIESSPRTGSTDVPAFDENDDALRAEEGRFVDTGAVFGADVFRSLITDLRPFEPFTGAETAQMATFPPSSAVVVARYPDPSAAAEAAERYLTGAVGFVPDIGSDGGRSAQRPRGDRVKVVVGGRTLLILSGPDEAWLAERLRASRVFASVAHDDEAVPQAPAGDFWLHRPAVLLSFVLVLILLATLWFFRGSTWAASTPAETGATPSTAQELRRRLLAINDLDVPFTVEEESSHGRIAVTWRFSDARWITAARAHGVRRMHRLVLELDEPRRAVRPTEYISAVDWSAGPRGAALEWRTAAGIVFFQTEHRRVFGLHVDENGRFSPEPDYSYTFDLQEMKAPLVAAVTRAGWDWRPTAWPGPSWLRWLTG